MKVVASSTAARVGRRGRTAGTRLGLFAAVCAVLATTVTMPGGTAGAATAPNGLIAYAAWDADQSGHDVWLTDPADPETAPVRLTRDGRYNNNPDWSPDGTRIAYDGYANFGSPRIWAMDADPATEDWAQLSRPTCTPQDGCFSDFQPAWSPDGQKLAFASNRSPDGWGMGGYELFMMDASGETPENPAVQPTDTRTGDHFDIWVVDVDNPTDLRNVTQSSDSDDTPSWSPDGTQIVYRSTRSGAYELWSLPVPPPAPSEPTSALRAASASPTDRASESESFEAAATPVPTRLTTNGGAENSPGDEQAADWGPRSGAELTVKKDGTGGGRVTSSPAGIACGADCTEAYDEVPR